MPVFPQKPDGFNKYAAGRKQYGGGRSMPTVGPVDKKGYKIRDRQTQTRRNALLRRMKASDKKNYMSSDWLRGQK